MWTSPSRHLPTYSSDFNFQYGHSRRTVKEICFHLEIFFHVGKKTRTVFEIMAKRKHTSLEVYKTRLFSCHRVDDEFKMSSFAIKLTAVEVMPQSIRISCL